MTVENGLRGFFCRKVGKNEQSFVTKTTDFIVRLRERMFFLKKGGTTSIIVLLLVFASKRIFFTKTKEKSE
ncbi:hypothetical protein CUS93_01940 [Enterococcus faecium]|nr:hypothetical protein CUS93_01940 [Enterococcus faecium]